MEEDNEFMPLSTLIKRDTKKGAVEVYQTQAEKGNKECNLIYLGKYTDIPVEGILNFDHLGYHCDLISFAMDYDEITNQVKDLQCLRTIGFLILKEDKIIASLEYMFEPADFLELKKKKRSVFEIKGKFLIKLHTKKNNIYKSNVIREYIDYSGREESIYILTSLIIEDDIIKRIESA